MVLCLRQTLFIFGIIGGFIGAFTANSLADSASDSLHRLQTQLDHRDPVQRMIAARELSTLGPRALPAATLLFHLAVTDPNISVRQDAIHTLKGLARQLTPEQRNLILKEANQILAAPSRPELRMNAIRGIGLATPADTPEKRTRLTHLALTESSHMVREVAAQELEAMGEAAKPAISNLMSAVVSKDIEQSARAITTLGYLGPLAANYSGVLKEIGKRHFRGDSETRQAAIFALGQFGPNAHSFGTSLIRTALDDPDAEVRKAAARSLEEMAGQPLREFTLAVRERLKEPKVPQEIKETNSQMLSVLSGGLLAEIFQPILHDSDSYNRNRALRYLEVLPLHPVHSLLLDQILNATRPGTGDVRSQANSTLTALSFQSPQIAETVYDHFWTTRTPGLDLTKIFNPHPPLKERFRQKLSLQHAQESPMDTEKAIMELYWNLEVAADFTRELIDLAMESYDGTVASHALNLLKMTKLSTLPARTSELIDTALHSPDADRARRAGDILSSLKVPLTPFTSKILSGAFSFSPIERKKTQELLKKVFHANPAFLDPLTHKLRASWETNATYAADALGATGPSALPYLAKALEDSRPGVRGAAALAIHQITQDNVISSEILGSHLMRAIGKGSPEAISVHGCHTLCTLAEQRQSWLNDLRSPLMVNTQLPWETAILSMSALFLVKAAPYCPRISKLPARVLEVLYPNAVSERSSVPTCSNDNPNSFPEIQDLKDDVFEVLSEDYSPTQNAKPISPVLYTKHFQLLLGRALNQENSEFQNTIEESFAQDLRRTPELKETSWGSGFNTYLLSASVLSSSRMPAETLKYFTDYAESFTYGVNGTPSYSPGDHRESEETSATRAPAFYLSLLMKGPPQNRSVYRSDLFQALRNFVKYMPHHMAQVTRDVVNTAKGPSFHIEGDGKAPYYFYSGLPYATAAIKYFLEKEPLTPEERAELVGLQTTIKRQLATFVKPDGNFVNEGTWHLDSTQAYDNAFAGLALLALVDECGGKKVTSGGILDDALIEAVDLKK